MAISSAATRLTRSNWLGIAVLISLVRLGDATANCARPVGYDVSVTGNQVTICPENWVGRGCPDPGGMLRQDISSGRAVRLPDRCSMNAAGKSCYVDTCVAPGQYRYGFAVPYECYKPACSTNYFAEAEVTAAEPCPAGSALQVASVPWGDSAVVCHYGGCATGLSSVAMPVLGLQALLIVCGLLIWRRQRRRRA